MDRGYVSGKPMEFSSYGGGYDTKTAIFLELGKDANITIKIYNNSRQASQVAERN